MEEKERTPEEKAKAKRIHKLIMTICGSGMALSGVIAAYLLFTAGGVPNFFFGLRPAAKTIHLPKNKVVSPSVIWRPFEQSSFDEAAKRGTLVLLNLTNSYCHSCKLMDEVVYRDPAVKAWIESNFVPVRADMDAQPSIVSKYQSKNWPTTALLLPSRWLISEGSLIPQERFIPWAQQVLQAYKAKPKTFEDAANAAEERRRAQPANQKLQLDFEKLKTLYDPKHGGFGGPRKHFQPEATETLFKIFAHNQDPQVLEMLQKTFDGQQKLQDPVSGGLFRCANQPDWTEPEYEMLLSVQRQAIKDWSRFLRIRKDAKLNDSLTKVIAFTETHLKDKKSGKYHFALSADAQLPDGGWLEGEDYYRSSEKNRSQAHPQKSPILVP